MLKYPDGRSFHVFARVELISFMVISPEVNGCWEKGNKTQHKRFVFKKPNKIAFESQWVLLLTLRTFSPIWRFVFPNQGGQTPCERLWEGWRGRISPTRATGLQLMPQECLSLQGPAWGYLFSIFYFIFLEDRFSSRGFYAIKIQQKLPGASWSVLNLTRTCWLWGFGWNIPAADFSGLQPQNSSCTLLSPFLLIPRTPSFTSIAPGSAGGAKPAAPAADTGL